MTIVSENDVLKALRGVQDPQARLDVVTSGLVGGIHIDASPAGKGSGVAVTFALEVDPARGPALEPLRQDAERAVAAVAGVAHVTAVLTARRSAPVSPKAASNPAPKAAPKAAMMDPHGMAKNPPLSLPVRHVVAVASGKGGVGKSTVAFNLAVALARAGVRTGLLDADIYGPSVPLLSGVRGRKPDQDEDGRILPIEAHGLKLMSIGFMVEDEAPMIWRGPMVQTALYQMMRDVVWGTAQDPLDVLIVDMPPGTGDAQLTLAQKVPVRGAVIVSTPQDLALIDARKAIEMFRKVHVPVLGVIENMSHYTCPSCGHEDHIFGHDGAQQEAAKQAVPYLGGIPLDRAIRAAADAGQPAPEAYYEAIAAQVRAALPAA